MKDSLNLQVSLDGRIFATGRFPPNMHPETHVNRINSALLSKTNPMPFRSGVYYLRVYYRRNLLADDDV
jgi:hypothetical protein